MPVTFDKMFIGTAYSRNQLAALWGYASYHAIARGIVTPQGDNKIVVFITEEKQGSVRQYVDRLIGDILETEGPDDHFAEGRIASADRTGDEIHLLHRKIHHSDFVYKGRIRLLELEPRSGRPSWFKYQII